MDGSRGRASPLHNTNHVLAKLKAYQTDTIRYNYRREKVHWMPTPSTYRLVQCEAGNLAVENSIDHVN